MELYNQLISAKILDGYEQMLDIVPQPQMLGGARMRNFVLPASTEFDYPATLSVGRIDGKMPSTIGDAFFKEFGDGFPDASLQENVTGGKIHLGKTLKKVGKVVAPVAKEMAKDAIEEGIRYYATGGKIHLGKTLKKVGKVVAPVAKEMAKDAIEDGIRYYATGAGVSGGKIHLGKTLKKVGKTTKKIGKAIAPVAKEVFDDVILPEGKEALRQYIRNSVSEGSKYPSAKEYDNEGGIFEGYGGKRRGRPPKRMVGTNPNTYTPQHGGVMIRGRAGTGKSYTPQHGGVMIRNAPSEYHSSVYPPALSSYAHGSGRAILPQSGAKRNSARGAIVAEVMKKHGLTLPQASKFVKEKGLY
jgi:hypothetical protein